MITYVCLKKSAVYAPKGEKFSREMSVDDTIWDEDDNSFNMSS